MERLTFDGNFCDIVKCDSTPGGPFCETGTCTIRRVWERLKEYEDTGLEPEEIKNALDVNDIMPEINVTVDQLRNILHAEQDGRLVVLPCKVGEHVWADGREAIVVWFLGYKTERYLHARFFDNAEHIDMPFYEIGKTVFLTREEAEAALKGASE